MTNFTLSQLQSLPKVESFRFDVQIFNADGEREETFEQLTSEIEERDNGFTLGVVVPEAVSSSYMASMLAFMKNITAINIQHNRQDGTVAFSTLHRVINFNGWKMTTQAFKSEILIIKADFNSEVSLPISQSEDGLREWLKEIKK